MSTGKLTDLIIALAIFLIAITDLYKGILMVVWDKHPLLFMARISLWLLKVLPISDQAERYDKALSVYISRRKLYGILAIIGGLWAVLLSVSILLNA